VMTDGRVSHDLSIVDACAVVQDCEGELRDNTVRSNRGGSVSIGDSADVDSADIASLNTLDRPPSRLEYR